MYQTKLYSLLIVSVVALTGVSAKAQIAPKMKPGLWQIHIEQERNGQKIANSSERMKAHMKDMTPERRKQFEEMMKQRGVDPNATDSLKVCYSQKMVEHGAWSDQFGCKTDFSDRSASSWKWHSVCSSLGYEGNGEAIFSDADNFTIRSSGLVTTEGETVHSKSTKVGKWLSADCGEVKPMDALSGNAQ